ncbi:MAG TPA: chitinase [Streptosporangiaceae bacterium]|nr:chitinase [Streptosporangiaceae bacterium]
MRRHVPGLAALAAAAATAATIGLAAPAASASTTPVRTLPRHVFAPYFETYDTSASPAALSRQSGAKYLTFAFLQTAQAGSCTAYWNGDTTQPVSPAAFGSDIAAIQASGGNVIPSFGGYGADTTSTDIADSCTSVAAIARVYENVITTYHISRIDLDVEADSLTNTAGISRRNEAIARVEAWAAARGLPVQFSYTLPTFPTGLTASGLAVLQDAVAAGARISVVNVMTFDYYLGPAQDMAADTESAGAAVVGQLRALYPGTPSARLWHMIGVTEMPGIDDFGPGETFSRADAVTVLHWARSHGIAALSFWALQRDNGGCPGTQGAGSCSGLEQPDWYFSHVFEPFTRAPAARP